MGQCDSPDRGKVEAKAGVRIAGEISQCKLEQPGGWCETSSVGGVVGSEKLLFEMHKGTRKLDQTLVIGAESIMGMQPQVFQHVMRLIVFPHIEATKVGEVAGIIA